VPNFSLYVGIDVNSIEKQAELRLKAFFIKEVAIIKLIWTS